MRIGIALQSLDATWGGIGIYTEEIVRALLRVDRANAYVLIYPGFGAPRKRFGQYRRFKHAVEVETAFSRVPSGLYWDQAILPRVARQHGVDVLFNPFLSVPIRGGFRKVLVLHNIEYHTVPQVYHWRLYARWFFLERVLLPRADRVIAISRAMTEDMRRLGRYPIDRVRTVYHGVSEKFRVIDDPARLAAARDEYELPARFILFVGHLYPQKNFATLVRAFHRIADRVPHDLVVVGRPRWRYEGDLALIDALGVRSRVHILYWVPNDDLPAIYNLADCFVYPSLYEAFGLAQLEAMACGCPVVGARAGAIPEVCGDAAVLFDPRDPDELAEALVRVLEDGALRRALVERGLARAREFTWERAARETLRVLEEAAADGGRRP